MKKNMTALAVLGTAMVLCGMAEAKVYDEMRLEDF